MGIKHDTVGTQLTQAEWEAADSHHITDLIPEADDTYDLGSATYAWQDLFLEGDITMTDAGTIATSAGALTITSAAAATWSTSAGALTLTSAGALNLNPAAGSAIVLDSTINVDAGVVTGATSITSTAFVGTLSTAAQTNITSLGTLTTLTVDNIIINGTNIGHTSDTDSIAIASDGVVTMNQIPVFSAGINVSGGSIAGTLSTASQTNITGVGTISAGTWQGTAIDGGYINDNIISGQAEITSGLADADELLYSDGGTVKRVGLDTLSTKILSGTATTATTASVATTVTITDNESTNEDNAIIFTAGGDVDGGNIGLESDGTLTYNPSTGKITATGFIGTLTGNADTATALASGRTIAMTGDVAWTSASFDGSGNVTGAGTIQADAVESGMLNDNIISGQTEITSGLATADELLYSDAGTLKRVGVDTLTSYLAGVMAGTVTSTGISDSSGVLTLDIQNMTASSTVVDADLVVIDDGAGGTLRKMTRANFIESAALDSINIDGGAIDGAVIGANSAAAITGTTITANTSIIPDAVGGADIGSTSAEWGDVFIADDKAIKFGNDQNATIEYDENGTDQLRIGGSGVVIENSVEIADDKFIEFASTAGTPASNDGVQGIVIEFLAAEALTQWDAVYASTTTGRVGRADANDAAKMPVIGVAIEAQGSAGSSVRVLTHGVFRDDGGFGGNLTPGNDVFAPETPGTLQSSIPADADDFVQVVGVAIGVRTAFINPDLTIIERAA
jgi:hypothetical protein